jgi:PAS domain S-box-containing protein
MGPAQIFSIVGLAPAIVLLWLLGLTAQRVGMRAVSYWLIGWGALLGSAWIILWVPSAPAIEPVSFLLSSLVAPLMLLGAYEHADRKVPAWVLPMGFAIGVLRLCVFELGAPSLASAIAAITEPVLALYAATVAIRWPEQPIRAIPEIEKLLGLGFALYACSELVDASAGFAGVLDSVVWGAWILGAFPLIALQISLHLLRFGRSAKANQSAAESNAQRLKILTDTSREVFVEFDDQGVITFASSNVGKLGGGGAEDLLGHRVTEYLRDALDSELIQSLVEGGSLTKTAPAAPEPTSHCATLPDGSQHWFEATYSTYRTTEDELRIVVRTSDITPRHLAETATWDRERRLNRAERIASVGSWEYYPKTQNLYCSEQNFRLFGLECREGPLPSTTFTEHIHSEDLAGPITKHTRRAPAGETVGLDFRITRTDDGGERTLRALFEVELDDDGEVESVMGASIDVTERLELETRLRNGQAHFRRLLESDIVGMCYANLDGSISRANHAFLSVLGYSEADLPLDWMEIAPEEFKLLDQQHVIEEMKTSGVLLPYEVEVLCSDGERVSMLIGATRLASEQALVIAVDLSERKRAEAYIARYQRGLEDTLARRTQELVESRDRLIESDRLASIGTLAAGLAHQINNPVGAILNSAEYALLCREDEEAAEIAEETLRANLSEAKRCAWIVRSMLQFSRGEPTEKWVEDLSQIVQRALRAIVPYAKDQSAVIDLRETQEEVILVQISPIQLEQALVNVLRNAIESSRCGAGISITISTRDKTARIEIDDDGRGIEEEHREHLFDPFYSTRTQEGGTGLGLSVAHGIVTDHGGEICIDSAVGEGTRVLITLPIAEPHEQGATRRKTGPGGRRDGN